MLSECKNKINLFLKNKELNLGFITIKILILYFLTVLAFYFSIGIYKLYKTYNYSLFDDPKLDLTIILTLVSLLSLIIIYLLIIKSKNKEETKLIASFLTIYLYQSLH